MKIKPAHYAKLEEAIRRVQSEYPKVTAQSYHDRGLTDMRFRWDLLAAAQRADYIKIGDGVGVSGLPLYEYLNDTHIDTALRKIVGSADYVKTAFADHLTGCNDHE